VLDMPLCVGGNARNRVCRLTTDMYTTHGQAAFGHNVETIIPSNIPQKWSKLFKAVRRVFSMRVENTYSKVQLPINVYSVYYSYLRVTPAKLSLIAKQYATDSAHLVRRFVRGLSIYVY
jgi:hypothetical protein